MDEIADDLGMSKKTLYRHFPGKLDLVREIVEQFMQETMRRQDRILSDESLDFPSRMYEFMEVVAKLLAKVTPAFIQDLQRSAPSVWEVIEETRQERIHLHINNLISEGQQKGLIRKDFDRSYIVFLISVMIREAVNPVVLSQFPVSLAEAFETVRSILFKGILSDKGRAHFAGVTGLSNGKRKT
jgi:AcrR family transcriptional regulator